MEKPVMAPKKEPTMEGRTRRRPEEVALDRRTAWKYRGLSMRVLGQKRRYQGKGGKESSLTC
jgi:hypothetical protein